MVEGVLKSTKVKSSVVDADIVYVYYYPDLISFRASLVRMRRQIDTSLVI